MRNGLGPSHAPRLQHDFSMKPTCVCKTRCNRFCSAFNVAAVEVRQAPWSWMPSAHVGGRDMSSKPRANPIKPRKFHALWDSATAATDQPYILIIPNI